MAKSITLYHGTDAESAKEIYKNGIKITAGSLRSDFGRGFYATEDYEQARIWAIRKSKLRRKAPAVVSFDFDVVSAEKQIRIFHSDMEWGEFIIARRIGVKLLNSRDYSITFGKIADGDVLAIAEELAKTGKPLTEKLLKNLLKANYPNQYAFHTNESLQFIKRITYQNL